MGRFVCQYPIALVALFFGTATATIINVTSDYSTIQMAIDNSSGGDTVRVETGIYSESIDFGGKNIVVGSWFLDAGDTSYISSTIIDAMVPQGTVVSFTNGENNSAVITGFTIRNGLASEGGGIYCFNGSNPTISFNIISGNMAGDGGGICCKVSSPIISNNTIEGNSSSGKGGGIYCFISNSIISHNTISGNSASQVGGGVYCFDLYPTISNNTISGNLVALDGGGIYITDFSDPTISYNIIYGNTAQRDGGGVYGSTSNATMTNNTISGNSSSGAGGGVYLTDYSNSTITNNIFWGDSASSDPEIYLDNSSPVITYCDVQDTLWSGTGNISCDPMFCEPDSGNFYLADSSCCVGAGQGGVDIGALGIGCGSEPIPTLSEWGMLIMGLLILAVGTVAVVRRRRATTVENA